MKKKFDFSAEIESAEARINQEYRERYEEENKPLKVNMEEFWLEHRDNHYKYSAGNWCSEIDGIIKVAILPFI